MSLLGSGYTAPAPKPERNATFRCSGCDKVERQPKTVSEVMHLCPKDSRMRTLKREET